MYYVSGGKIYSTVKGASTNKYAELEMYKATDGVDGKPRFALRVKDAGVVNKPANRRLCTMEELIAQYGASADKPAAKKKTTESAV